MSLSSLSLSPFRQDLVSLRKAEIAAKKYIDGAQALLLTVKERLKGQVCVLCID